MALTQRRVLEIRRITSEAEYRAALARIDELASAEDIDSRARLAAERYGRLLIAAEMG